MVIRFGIKFCFVLRQSTHSKILKTYYQLKMFLSLLKFHECFKNKIQNSQNFKDFT